MVNNRSTNFIVINYINSIDRILNQAHSEIDAVTETDSISYDFINQILPYQKAALRIAEQTLRYTKRQQVLSVARLVNSKYPEIMADLQKIKNLSGKFKNCYECTKKYHKGFRQITEQTFLNFKKINRNQNINSYFLSLMEEYHQSQNKMLESLLKYRICPQLRLIAEYMLCLNKKDT